jgi:hypothetical protein
MLKLVKFQSLVVKCFKIMEENIALRNLQISLYYVVHFPMSNTNEYKICKFRKAIYFPHFTTFRNQTCNFTNFNMLFLAVVMDCVLLA